jgi:hypothetical protein
MIPCKHCDSDAISYSPLPSPTLDGTVSRCGKYYEIGGNEDFGTVEKKFGISLSDL